VTTSIFRPSASVRLVSSIERLAFPLTRPPLSASTTRPSTLAPPAATTQSPAAIGSSRIAENASPAFADLVESSRVVLIVIT
jgi:hypothetical protein